MKKLMRITGFLAMSFFILPGCHKEGKDNNMNMRMNKQAGVLHPVSRVKLMKAIITENEMM